MDTQRIAAEHFDQLGWHYDIDPLTGTIFTRVAVEGEAGHVSLFLQLEPRATALRLRARRLVGSGGRGGRLDPACAADVALLAYDVGLQLGVDKRDGEIEARAEVHFAGVSPGERAAVFAAHWDDFLERCAYASCRLTAIFASAEREDDGDDARTAIDLARPLAPSA